MQPQQVTVEAQKSSRTSRGKRTEQKAEAVADKQIDSTTQSGAEIEIVVEAETAITYTETGG